MLGADIQRQCQVVQHDAFDAKSHRQVGTVLDTRTPALIESAFLDQDVRLTTGFIEPHFFAGFSGGPKMVAPGLAALETVLDLHSAKRIGDERATWGITQGNPVHDAVRAIATQVGVTFNLDVTLNRDHAITNVFSGEILASHAAGCLFAHQTAMAPVPKPYDVVLTTNSGYPLDQNLYQTVKGMSAAAQIVKRGGSIVVASECSDGVPEHGGYKDLLREGVDPDAFMTRLFEPSFSVHDQWQVQVQAQIQRKVQVFLKADGLSEAQIRAVWPTVLRRAWPPRAWAPDWLFCLRVHRRFPTLTGEARARARHPAESARSVERPRRGWPSRGPAGPPATPGLAAAALDGRRTGVLDNRWRAVRVFGGAHRRGWQLRATQSWSGRELLAVRPGRRGPHRSSTAQPAPASGRRLPADRHQRLGRRRHTRRHNLFHWVARR